MCGGMFGLPITGIVALLIVVAYIAERLGRQAGYSSAMEELQEKSEKEDEEPSEEEAF